MRLPQAYRGELAPAVVNMLGEANKACPPGAAATLAGQDGAETLVADIPAAVLHKDAIYAAAGTGAYELHDYVDFQPWLQHTLLQVDCVTARACKSLPKNLKQLFRCSGHEQLPALSAAAHTLQCAIA